MRGAAMPATGLRSISTSPSPTSTAAVARATAAGAVLESPATVHSWGTIAMLADPFGHGFCLIEFSEQGYDAIAD